MEPNRLGIDHPVVAVRDLAAAAAAWRRLGFHTTPLSRHPWGTANHLVVLDRDFIELIAVDRASKIVKPVNPEDFRFGAPVAAVLERRQGIAMLALHSEAARADHDAAVGRGVPSAGIVVFRREVLLAGGRSDTSAATLGLFWNEAQPGLSTYAYQQHRPDLVWRPEWRRHANGADAVLRVTYCAGDPEAARPYYAALYGEDRIGVEDAGLKVRTPNGQIQVVSANRLADRFAGVVAETPAAADLPCGVAIRVRTPGFVAARAVLEANDVPYAEVDEVPGRRILRVGAEDATGVILELTDG